MLCVVYVCITQLMVGGVHGHMAHAVRHVVEEHSKLLENAIILHLHVEEITAVVIVPTRTHVAIIVVLVRSLCKTLCVC